MAKKRRSCFLAVVCLVLHISVEGAPRHHHHKQDLRRAHKEYENPKSRSYIDIDASDPFKVPKNSQYIDQPVPEYSKPAEEKEQQHDDEADGSQPDEQSPKNFDNIQDDLKKMGLGNIDNGATINSNDEQKIENNAPEEQPIVEQDNANVDATKAIEIGDVGQNYKNLGEPSSRQSVENTENVENAENAEEGPPTER